MSFRASFETAASRPPQDEGTFLMPQRENLILRSAAQQRVSKDARTNLQRSQHRSPDRLFSAATTLIVTPAKAGVQTSGPWIPAFAGMTGVG
jgi:hypothetical protein